MLEHHETSDALDHLPPRVPLHRLYAPVLAGVLGVTVAAIVVLRTTHTSMPGAVETYANGQKVTLRGVIVDEPDRRPLQTKYTVEVWELETGSGIVQTGVQGLVLATDHRTWPEFRFGDSVTLRGKLERPGTIEDFRYDNYLSRYGIYSVMHWATLAFDTAHFPQIGGKNTHRPQFLRTRRTLFALKTSFENRINRLLPEPHASFMAGLLTGSRRGIPESLLEDFRRTGLTHIIAISGYNITIVIAAIGSLLFWLPHRARLLPSVAAIAAFTVFVGANAAVVRAATMGILGLVALQAKRKSHARLALLWTAFFMLSGNPKLLWYDAGFQLSFLAVAGLIELAPILAPYLRCVPRTFGIRESLLATIAAQIAAVPLVVALFGNLSLIAPLANVLIAPAIPAAMLLGFFGVLASIIVFPLGQLVSAFAWACLQWIILVAETLSQLPISSMDVQWSTWGVGAYYTTIICLIAHIKRRRSPSVLPQLPPPLEPRNL